MSFKRPIRLQAEATFEERKGKENFVEYEFKDYKGASFILIIKLTFLLRIQAPVSNLRFATRHHPVTLTIVSAHGFAARPNLAIPEVKEGYEGALNQTVEWFDKTIPA